MINVFVYGTLKPGESNYGSYCEGLVRSQTLAYTQGNLYNLSLGYPGLTEGDNQVKGVLLTFSNSDILLSLDQLEDYLEDRPLECNEYYRTLVPVYSLQDEFLGKAWCYLMTIDKVRQYHGKAIALGWWTSQ
ncbi:MAG: gamma-glutamylcyclotransferase [Pleurocapsa sp.]